MKTNCRSKRDSDDVVGSFRGHDRNSRDYSNRVERINVSRYLSGILIVLFGMVSSTSLALAADGVPKSNLCVGLRGNGPYLWTHFGALARIVETLGPIDVMSGGSSATISMFLAESIHSNPLVNSYNSNNHTNTSSSNNHTNTSSSNNIFENIINKTDSNTTIDDSNENEEYYYLNKVARISFLIKSIEGWLENGVGYLLTSPWETVMGFRESIMETDILDRLESGDMNMSMAAVDDLIIFLQDYGQAVATEIEDFILSPPPPIINPEVIELLSASSNPVPLALEILASTNFNFEASDTKIFIRPALFNWDSLGPMLDVIGSYYIGYEPVDLMDMEFMLDQCALQSLGMEWPEIATLKTESGTTCGTLFKNNLYDYFEARNLYSTETPPPNNRMNDPIGSTYFTSIAQVAGLTGNTSDAFQQARATLLNGDSTTYDSVFDVNFDDVRFGYWGNDNVLNTIEENLKRNPEYSKDLKSQKFYPLGLQNWLYAIVRSPAEPGLSRGIETMPNNFISVGGWGDLTPAQILDSLNMKDDGSSRTCETIILVNHPTLPDFALDVAELLGATENDLNSLYDITNSTSSWTQSLHVSDANLCYKRNTSIPITNTRDLFHGGWTAPLTTTDESLRSMFPEDDNPSAILEACTPLFVEGGTSVDSTDNDETSPDEKPDITIGADTEEPTAAPSSLVTEDGQLSRSSTPPPSSSGATTFSLLSCSLGSSSLLWSTVISGFLLFNMCF